VTKRLMIVGEAWGQQENLKGLPFVGPAGKFLHAFLSAVGIDRNDVYLTNVFNFQPVGNKIGTLCGPKGEGIPNMPPAPTKARGGSFIRAEFATELHRLDQEIEAVNPNLIVAAGAIPSWALLREQRTQIKRLRGAPAQAYNGRKVLPINHPSAVLRDFKLRPVFFNDLEKAKAEMEFPEIRRPERTFWLNPTLSDLANFDKYITPDCILSVDIETAEKQITCIGFAPSKDRALVVPFWVQSGSYWPTLEEELQAWKWVRKWLGDHRIRKIGQNFLYDCRYLWQLYGIEVRNVHDDTMLLHHAIEPEMEKSLGFLGSLYTSEPSWKFMRGKHQTLKKED